MPVKSEKPTRRRASSPKKPAKAEVASAEGPVKHDEIARRAYFIYLEELDNWLRAERELAAA